MAKSNKTEVGKGIKALLSNIDKKSKSVTSPEGHVLSSQATESMVALKHIEPNPWQPRKAFDDDKLNELQESIRVHGIIQPIAVRKLSAKSYQIISGERRWRAAKALGLSKVPVHIIKADDQTMLEIALIENIQRDDLNPMEVALSYRQLIDECNLTHDDLSQRLGKKRSSISNYLRLLKLSTSVQHALRANEISMGHAKSLAAIDEVELQTSVLGIVLRDGLSVRATESAVKRVKATRDRKKAASEVTNDPNVSNVEQRLSEYLGSPVHIKYRPDGIGKISISFKSTAELNDIIDAIEA